LYSTVINNSCDETALLHSTVQYNRPTIQKKL